MTDPIAISVPKAAPMVGVSPNTLYRMARRGDFPPAVRIGRRWIVYVDGLRKWLAEEAS